MIIKVDIKAMEALFGSEEARVELQRCVVQEFVKRHWQIMPTSELDAIIKRIEVAMKPALDEYVREHIGKDNWNTATRFTLTKEAKATIETEVNKAFESKIRGCIETRLLNIIPEIQSMVKKYVDFNI